MAKFTRRFKKYKNKTIKRGGADPEPDLPSENTVKTDINTQPEIGSNLVNNSNVVDTSNTENGADAQVEAIPTGEHLGSGDDDYESPEDVANDTVNGMKKLVGTVNETLGNKDCEEKTKQAIQDALDLVWGTVGAVKEPIDKFADNTVESFTNAIPKVQKSITNSVWNAIGTLPPLNIATNLISTANDVSSAARTVSKATNDTIQSAYNTYNQIQEKLKELKEKKRTSRLISKRTDNSINEFENPLNAQQRGGGYKTRRRLFKHKAKSKRVRFAI
jgi:hypothetical protein